MRQCNRGKDVVRRKQQTSSPIMGQKGPFDGLSHEVLAHVPGCGEREVWFELLT
jgi:hypothetical protein